jgi:hydrogenase maturation protease
VSSERITVMGIGNPLMRDEGIGIRVVEELMAAFEFPENVTLVDAGTMGMTIVNLFQDCDYMIVVDAIEGTGHEPGTVVRMSPEDLAPNQVMHSLHDVRLVDVLQMAMLMGIQPHVECIGIQIEDMGELSIGLTAALEAAVPAALEAVGTLLGERGITLQPRDESDTGADTRGPGALRNLSAGPN